MWKSEFACSCGNPHPTGNHCETGAASRDEFSIENVIANLAKRGAAISHAVRRTILPIKPIDRLIHIPSLAYFHHRILTANLLSLEKRRAGDGVDILQWFMGASFLSSNVHFGQAP